MSNLDDIKSAMAAGTQGEWTVDGPSIYDWREEELTWFDAVAEPLKTDEANARATVLLHNAWPDLLAVVEAARTVADTDWKTGLCEDEHPERTARMDALRAALAALEGR